MRRIFIALTALFATAVAYALVALFGGHAHAQLMTLGYGLGGKAAGGGPVMMVTPMMGGYQAPSTSVANFASLVSGGNSAGLWTANTTVRQVPFSVAGTFTNLHVNFPSAVAAGTWKLTLFQNGSGVALTCSATASATFCEDTTHSVTVAPTDLLQWQMDPAGTTPTAEATLQIGWLFTSTVGQESPLCSGGTTAGPSNAGTVYTGFQGANTGWQATETTVSGIMPIAGTIDRLYIWASGAPGAAKSYTITNVQNGTPGSLTAGLTGTGSGAGITTNSDLNAGHAFTVAAGDTISLQSVEAGTPSTPSSLTACLRFVPTVSNKAPLFQSAMTVPATTTTKYMNVSGNSAGNGTESLYLNVAPVLASTMTLGDLTVAQDVTPGGATTRAVTLRSGGTTNQSPTCTVNSASFTGVIGPSSTALTATAITGTIAIGQEILTGAGVTGGTRIVSGSGANWVVNNSQTVVSEAMTSGMVIAGASGANGFLNGCSNNSNTYSPTTGTLLSESTAATGTNAALSWYKTSMSVTVP